MMGPIGERIGRQEETVIDGGRYTVNITRTTRGGVTRIAREYNGEDGNSAQLVLLQAQGGKPTSVFLNVGIENGEHFTARLSNQKPDTFHGNPAGQVINYVIGDHSIQASYRWQNDELVSAGIVGKGQAAIITPSEVTEPRVLRGNGREYYVSATGLGGLVFAETAGFEAVAFPGIKCRNADLVGKMFPREFLADPFSAPLETDESWLRHPLRIVHLFGIGIY